MKNSKKSPESYPQNDIMVRPTSTALQLRSDFAQRLWGKPTNTDVILSHNEFRVKIDLVVAKANVFLDEEKYAALSSLLDEPIMARHSDFPFITIFASTMTMLENLEELNLSLFLNQTAQLIDMYETRNDPSTKELLEKLIAKAYQVGLIDQLISLNNNDSDCTSLPNAPLKRKELEQIKDFLGLLILWNYTEQPNR